MKHHGHYESAGEFIISKDGYFRSETASFLVFFFLNWCLADISVLGFDFRALLLTAQQPPCLNLATEWWDVFPAVLRFCAAHISQPCGFETLRHSHVRS